MKNSNDPIGIFRLVTHYLEPTAPPRAPRNQQCGILFRIHQSFKGVFFFLPYDEDCVDIFIE
jgi:hypothetical protein